MDFSKYHGRKTSIHFPEIMKIYPLNSAEKTPNIYTIPTSLYYYSSTIEIRDVLMDSSILIEEETTDAFNLKLLLPGKNLRLLVGSFRDRVSGATFFGKSSFFVISGHTVFVYSYCRKTYTTKKLVETSTIQLYGGINSVIENELHPAYGRFFFIKSNMLCMYNDKNNQTTEVLSLSDFAPFVEGNIRSARISVSIDLQFITALFLQLTTELSYVRVISRLIPCATGRTIQPKDELLRVDHPLSNTTVFYSPTDVSFNDGYYSLSDCFSFAWDIGKNELNVRENSIPITHGYKITDVGFSFVSDPYMSLSVNPVYEIGYWMLLWDRFKLKRRSTKRMRLDNNNNNKCVVYKIFSTLSTDIAEIIFGLKSNVFCHFSESNLKEFLLQNKL